MESGSSSGRTRAGAGCSAAPPAPRKVVGETASGEEALGLARSLLPDVVLLLDVSMPGWNGIVTAEKIAMACPATVIVMLTGSDPEFG